MTRTAFRATLKIGNESPQPLGNVNVSLDIRDADGLPTNDLFGVAEPLVDGLADVAGGGTIPPGMPGEPMEATAEWLLIPTDEAAPTEEPSVYTVGGTLSYVTGGNQVTIPLFPAEIRVRPDAKLFLNYFLQGQVYSDNPFTPDIVEPAEPFSLGLLVRNEGFGIAQKMHIMSGQPTIVDNQSGLPIAFQIIGTQVGMHEHSPSLNVDFGDIGPDESAVARWRLTSSLQGRFIKYDATFEHLNGLNIPGLSLIDAVDIFELNHIVKLDGPGADGLPDFLVNNTAEGGCAGDSSGAPGDDIPDCVHSSDGSVLSVRTIASAISDGPPTPMDQIVMLTVPVTDTGWHYIRLDDPGMETFNLASVVRMGPGKTKRQIVVGDSGSVSNAWTTHRHLPIDGPPDRREDLLHLFDHFTEAGTYDYELAYVGGSTLCSRDSDCDDGDPCTLDTCVPATGCGHSNAGVGTACGDPSESACDRPDTCDGAGHCKTNLAADGVSCSDGLFCNGAEVCLGGLCTDRPDPCADIQHCDERRDRCLDCISHAECADDDPCTIDHCKGGRCMNRRDPRCTDRAVIEIGAGSCPTTVDPRSTGFLPVTLLGNQAIDVADVDPRSLRLVRTDGVGTAVSPTGTPAVRDVSSPTSGDPCFCVSPARMDGVPDLNLDFVVEDMNRAMKLSSIPTGSSVSLALTGRLTRGAPFEAKDCLTITRGRDTMTRESKITRPPD